MPCPHSPLLRLVFLRPRSFFDFEVEDFVAFYFFDWYTSHTFFSSSSCLLALLLQVNDFDAFDECHATAAAGFMVGGSSGMNICASRVVASQCAAEPPREGGVTIVTLLCDHGIKYMSKVRANAGGCWWRWRGWRCGVCGERTVLFH